MVLCYAYMYIVYKFISKLKRAHVGKKPTAKKNTKKYILFFLSFLKFF